MGSLNGVLAWLGLAGLFLLAWAGWSMAEVGDAFGRFVAIVLLCLSGFCFVMAGIWRRG